MDDSKDGRLSPPSEESPDDEVPTAEADDNDDDEPRSEMKDYAESTMNELLGLYGFEKFDRTETEHLNVDRFTSPKADDSLSPLDDASRDDVSVGSCDSSSGRSDLSRYNRSRSNSETNLAAQHRNLVTALTKKHGLTGAPEEPFHLAPLSVPGVRRRETQLQFCSSKCLNQYKMNIFVKRHRNIYSRFPDDGDKIRHRGLVRPADSHHPDLWLSNAKHKNAKLRRKEAGDTDRELENAEKMESKSDHSRRQSPTSASSSSDKLPVTNRIPRSKSPDSAQPPELEFPLFLLTCGAPQPLGWVFPLWERVPPWFYPGFMPPGFMPPNMPMEGLSGVLPSRTETPSATNNKRFALSPNYDNESSKNANEERGHGRSSLDRYRLLEVTHLDRVPSNTLILNSDTPSGAPLPNGVGMFGQNG
uniref:Uncharacterized protein n=1 Tax=Magallana gigas TaxID=29159 RepID=A0A8W8JGH0_MAGGI